MNELEFLGLSASHWDLINSFAEWFAAAGSIAAAMVALYIANRAVKPSAKVSAALEDVKGFSTPDSHEGCVRFKIVNTGDRPIRVTQVNWKVGLFRKRIIEQTFDVAQNPKLPIDLTHGQEASWEELFFLKLSTIDEIVPAKDLARKLTPYYRTALCTLRGQIHTSTGFVFTARPEPKLRKYLREVCKSIARTQHRDK